MNRRDFLRSGVLLSSLLAVVLPLSAADAPATAKPSAKPANQAKPPAGPARFEKDIAAYEATDKMSPPPQGAVLFYGASSIRLWKTLKEDFPGVDVFNRAFGGSQISDCIHFAPRVVLPYKPRLIVFQAAGNDINAGKSPEQVLADYKQFVALLRADLPKVRIAFMGIGPSPARWSQREKQQQANALVKAYVATDPLQSYIDIWEAHLGPDGAPVEALFVSDKLHPSAEGYKIRVALTKPYVK
ncbi:GDSL-type esterase/lipase family protein [Humisphaera borealis]|uniref:SGNH hydrolase-type esterase domain-containing protein n=1 Tax=Humisphaera borealis TaxID=2807512 RepID=A0A7M2WSC7_9BACT|nr:GDSL-type esterase/lipase family protein [Humisphaera borealis]QOV87701.1 hypothetical protein IPV69_15560 [Humisphaera borealis]